MSKPTCSVDGCDRNGYTDQWCKFHYQRVYRTGSPHGSQRRSTEARFWQKVEKTETCWLWKAALLQSGGYGQFWMNGTMHRSHRVAYEFLVGPIPEGMFLDHTCYVPACVNPAHLRPTTPKENNENRSGPQMNSASGVRGVIWEKDRQAWRAGVFNGGKFHLAGRFPTKAEAEVAAIEKRNELFTHNNMDRHAS